LHIPYERFIRKIVVVVPVRTISDRGTNSGTVDFEIFAVGSGDGCLEKGLVLVDVPGASVKTLHLEMII
jgi:hypothetical protein